MIGVPETIIPSKDEVNKESKSLIENVINDLGGVVFTVEAIDKTLEFAGIFFKKNKKYQFCINSLRRINPVIITGHKIFTSVKSYKDQQKHKYARQKKVQKILNIIGFGHLEEFELNTYNFDLGKEIFNWFASKPMTDNFKIVDFYNSEFDIVSSKCFDRGEYYILVEYKGEKSMIESEISIYNNQITVIESMIHTTSGRDKVQKIKSAIFSEFVNYFDTKNNVMEMNIKGLSTRPKIGFDYSINQFDVDGFKSEIIKTFEKGKKRGYILVGPPGVGKSTIIVKLENELPNIPIIYISSSSSSFKEDVINIFNFIRSISPCIVIFEDLDSYELSNKNDRLFGEFIEQMDSLKHNESVIIIATLNEPENIHTSLINRRGRFDKVFYIDYPKKDNEIINVMKNKYNKETGKDFPFDHIHSSTIKKIISNRFTHADICEVINSIIINDINLTQESIDGAVDGVIQTMRAISICEEKNEE